MAKRMNTVMIGESKQANANLEQFDALDSQLTKLQATVAEKSNAASKPMTAKARGKQPKPRVPPDVPANENEDGQRPPWK